MSTRRWVDLILAGTAKLRDITRVAAPAGSTPGHVVTVGDDGESLTLAAPTGGSGGEIPTDGAAHGDLLYFDAAAGSWVRLHIPPDHTERDYVLGTAFGRPAWRTVSSIAFDPLPLTADVTTLTADTTAVSADQTEY